MAPRRACGIVLSSCLAALVAACSGSSGTDVSGNGVTTSRPDFVTACNARTAFDAGAEACPHAGKCDALFTCIDAVVDPALRDRVLQCETQACTTKEKRFCLEQAAQTVSDPAATAWAATCDDRAARAGVDDDGCQKGAAALSAAYRAEFDRCLGLSKSEAETCVKVLNARCETTYF